MVSDSTIKFISQAFCGDLEDFYSYKSGPKLVLFFNENFGYTDIYSQGFPSRWFYVADKLHQMIDEFEIDAFFSLILDKAFIMNDLGISEVEAAEKSEKFLFSFNRSLEVDKYTIIHKGNEYQLVEKNTDLLMIGSGGFANVYMQKSTGIIVKKLKDEFLADSGIRKRFKREYAITKSLENLTGIISVFSFDEGSCSYTMEAAEQTLDSYVKNKELAEEEKLSLIRQILFIMSEVHEKDVIHRDLSPNNIFIISGKPKIADFGLGKDLNALTTRQTQHTNAFGQYYYCAPEQFSMLRDGDKRSDVFSLGRVINYVINRDPTNSHHKYRVVVEKATNNNPDYRFSDAKQMMRALDEQIEYQNRIDRIEQINSKIQNLVFDKEVEGYLYDLSSEDISKLILFNNYKNVEILITFMKQSENHAMYIIQSIETSFKGICETFESHDPFATFSERVLREKFSFVVKERAAIMLKYVAWDVNRFYAQHLVNNLIKDGIEPMLENIIKK